MYSWLAYSLRMASSKCRTLLLVTLRSLRPLLLPRRAYCKKRLYGSQSEVLRLLNSSELTMRRFCREIVAPIRETMEPEQDPAESHAHPHPWLPAEAASYVVGVPRARIMGPPVLSYADRASAGRVALRYPDARVLDLAGLERWWREETSR